MTEPIVSYLDARRILLAIHERRRETGHQELLAHLEQTFAEAPSIVTEELIRIRRATELDVCDLDAMVREILEGE